MESEQTRVGILPMFMEKLSEGVWISEEMFKNIFIVELVQVLSLPNFSLLCNCN
jgi:hypothetical protein